MKGGGETLMAILCKPQPSSARQTASSPARAGAADKYLKLKGQEEEWGEGIFREFGRDMYPLLYLKWITNKDLLYSTGNSAQRYVDGKGV